MHYSTLRFGYHQEKIVKRGKNKTEKRELSYFQLILGIFQSSLLHCCLRFLLVCFKYHEKPSFEAFFIKNTQGIFCKINFNSNSSSFGVWFCFSFLPDAPHVFFFWSVERNWFRYSLWSLHHVGNNCWFCCDSRFFVYLSYYYSFEQDRSLPMPSQKFSNENSWKIVCLLSQWLVHVVVVACWLVFLLVIGFYAMACLSSFCL